jgi:hypothetical protein
MRSFRTHLTLAVFVIMALAMMDIFIDVISQRGHVCKTVVGTNTLISGKLMGSIKPYAPQSGILGNRIDDPALINEILVYEPAYSAFRLHFLEFKGRIWRAELLTDSGAAPGDYPVRIHQNGVQTDPDMPELHVRIFPDVEALRASQASLFRRHLGIAPWAAAIGLLPIVLLLLYRTYRLADGTVSALQARGLGPIYKMAYRKTGWEILFGLGSDHGLRNGDVLELLDGRHRPVGHEIVAFHVGPESGEATVDPKVKLAPGFLVYRPPSAGKTTPSDPSRIPPKQ